MKKHQLLEKAMRDYPAGTIFKSALTPSFNKTHISSGIFEFNRGSVACVINEERWFVWYDLKDTWAEIVHPEPEKAGLLDGKCAIQVSNEREFKLLMDHYEGKGWKWCSGLKPNENVKVKFPTSIFYGNEFYWDLCDGTNEVTFEDFAKEVGIDVPVYIMDSEDGVPLYHYDDYHWVHYNQNKSTWIYREVVYNSAPSASNPAFCDPKNSKAFHSKEAAEAWIKEQNKPKEVIVKLHGGYTVRVEKDKATFAINNFGITGEELEEIYQTYKSLQ